jgi:hypothetical protein
MARSAAASAGDLDDLGDRKSVGWNHAIERLSVDQFHGEKVEAR